jgi:hypothetical protein
MAAIAKNDESERREKRGQVFFSHPNERVNEMKEKAETLTSGLFFFLFIVKCRPCSFNPRGRVDKLSASLIPDACFSLFGSEKVVMR